MCSKFESIFKKGILQKGSIMVACTQINNRLVWCAAQCWPLSAIAVAGCLFYVLCAQPPKCVNLNFVAPLRYCASICLVATPAYIRRYAFMSDSGHK